MTPLVETSLRNLRTDDIDLYQMHRPDPLTTTEETVRALDDLGKSGMSEPYLAEALGERRKDVIVATKFARPRNRSAHAVPAQLCLNAVLPLVRRPRQDKRNNQERCDGAQTGAIGPRKGSLIPCKRPSRRHTHNEW
ncbi:MAG: aldo/keto reductase [Hyphomicrobiaceae bacterium]|nr:aldo/keto reductase [Hyphomicrobiaceae bacterium]